MISRRSLFISVACAAAAGAAYGLEPRQRLVLLSGAKMADVLPLRFADWSAENSDGLVQPAEAGSLAASLYSEMVGRIYHQAVTGAAVMMLVAYGDTQSDLLQLHRPEACYPAVGFTLVSSQSGNLDVGRGISIPVRRVVATMGDRQENIVYWARLGEYLPNSAGDQRAARLRASMRGYVPDGGLFRFSVLSADSEEAFAIMDTFIPALISAVAAPHRRALLGTDLASKMIG